MRKLTIVTDKIIYKDIDNNYYSAGGFSRQIEGFLPYYNELTVCTRVKNTNEAKLLNPLNSKITVDELPFNSSTKSKVMSVIKYCILINKYSKEWNEIQLRMPSISSVIAYFILKIKKKEKFIVYGYVGGHPYRGILHTRKGFIGHLLAGLNHKISTRIFKKHQTFVTGNEIYNDYKKYNVKKIISTTLSKEEIISDEDLHIRNNKTLKIIFVGRLSKEKGIEILLKASAKIKNQYSIKIVIVGDGPEKEHLMQLVKDLNLEGIVDFKGLISNRLQLQGLFDESDIFVLPSLTEGTPKVILEAMSRGLPVVASNVGGIPSVITHEKNGLLYDVGDTNQLSEIIVNLHLDSQKRMNLALNGLKFSRKNTLDNLSDFIDKELDREARLN